MLFFLSRPLFLLLFIAVWLWTRFENIFTQLSFFTFQLPRSVYRLNLTESVYSHALIYFENQFKYSQ